MTQRYTTNAKEVLRNGTHFADCIDDGAARLIADTLNERRGMPQVQRDLPLADNGPLFIGDRVAARSHTVRQEHDEYACSCGRRWDVADGEVHP